MKNIPERHRRTDGRTIDVLWHHIIALCVKNSSPFALLSLIVLWLVTAAGGHGIHQGELSLAIPPRWGQRYLMALCG